MSWLWERLTGRPWTTVRSCTAEFGPPPGARHAAQLAAYTNAELLARDRDEILAEIRRREAAVHPGQSKITVRIRRKPLAGKEIVR